MSYYPNSAKKAFAFTVFLVLLGIASFWLRVDDLKSALPLIIFYIVIVTNTFFSVRCFSSIIPPENKLQWTIDASLAVAYILMAFNMNNPLRFVFWAAVLFSIAALKYATLLPLKNYLEILKYKIIIDSMGTLSCVLALGGIIFGHSALAIWTWTIIFSLANIFIFFVKPLYKLPK